MEKVVYIPFWFKITGFVLAIVLTSALILAIVTAQSASNYATELIAQKLASYAALNAIKIQRNIGDVATQLGYTLSRSVVTDLMTAYDFHNDTSELWDTFTSQVEAGFELDHVYCAMRVYTPQGRLMYAYSNANEINSSAVAQYSDAPNTRGPYANTSYTNSSVVTTNNSSLMTLLPLEEDRSNAIEELRSLNSSAIVRDPIRVRRQYGDPPDEGPYLYSMSLPIVLIDTNLTTNVQTRRILGFATVVLFANPITTIEYDADEAFFDKSSLVMLRLRGPSQYSYVLPAIANSTSGRYSDDSVRRSGRFLAECDEPHSISEYPVLLSARDLHKHDNEQPQGALMKTHVPFLGKASVGYSYVDLGDHKWYVIAAISQSTAHEEVHRMLQVVVASCAGIIVGVIVLVLPLSKGQTRSFYKIHDGMNFGPPTTEPPEPNSWARLVRRIRRPSSAYSLHSKKSIASQQTLVDVVPSIVVSSTPDSPASSEPSARQSTKKVMITSNQAPTVSVKSVELIKNGSTVTLSKRPGFGRATRTDVDEWKRRQLAHRERYQDEVVYQIPAKIEPLNRWYTDEWDDIVSGYNKIIDYLEVQHQSLGKEVARRTKEAEMAKITAEAANQAKRVFIANITHELRTPMNGIMGMTTVSASENDRTKIQASLRTIIDSGSVLMELLNELLSYSKSQVGPKPELTECRLEELVESLCNATEAKAKAASVSMRLSLLSKKLKRHSSVESKLSAAATVVNDTEDDSSVSHTGLCVRGDIRRVQEIAMNVLSNAIKFSDCNSVVSVEVRLQSSGDPRITLKPYSAEDANLLVGVLEVRVQDCGMGIGPKQMESVFDMFTQGDSSLSKRHNGTGLGMCVAKQLADCIGGYITIVSEVGVGTTVIIRAPVHIIGGYKPSQIKPVDIVKYDQPWSISSLEPNRVIAGVPMGLHRRTASAATFLPLPAAETVRKEDFRVLVADDNEINQRVLVGYLKSMGIVHIDVAENGAKAIALVEQAIIDGLFYNVIFMDLQMPVVDGIEATHFVRSTLGYPYPIIALTGIEDSRNIAAHREGVIQGIIVKPVIKARLEQTLACYMSS